MWPFTGHDVIDVKFLDAESGMSIARSSVPIAQLPDSFVPDTTLEIAGKPYSVTRADPLTKSDFRRSGRLLLHVVPILLIDPSTVLFTLPTIDERWPPMEPAPDQPAGLSMHEDDWRQVEFISSDLGAQVETELDSIREVMANARKGSGFTRIHVRDQITSPIGQELSIAEVGTLFGIAHSSPAPVRIDRLSGRVRDGGSLPIAEGLWAYWLAPHGRVAVLGLHGQLQDAGPNRWEPARRRGFILVDRCRAKCIR